MTERDNCIEAFLARHGWAGADRGTLADDASFRRYERVVLNGKSAVLMDAPPDKEDVRPFVTITKILSELNLSAPRLFGQDPERGFLLLEDLGDDTYTHVLNAVPNREEELYMLAVDLLIALHGRFISSSNIPSYNDAGLATETELLLDWYLPAVTGKAVTDTARRAYHALWQPLFALTRTIPETLVLRDYHVDNLIWLPQRPGVEACGLLDFQDAVVGSVAYDLVSLLQDARRNVPVDLAGRAIDRYLAAFPEVDPETFRTAYAILGAQRSAKILGIFTRLDRRDRKPDYLCHIPQIWRWLDGDLRHPALSEMHAWFEDALPPDNRTIPEQMTGQ